MEINVRQLVVIFPEDGDIEKVNISTVYTYVEHFGRIISCEQSRNGLNIRMIEVDGVSAHWVNSNHDIDGHRLFMRRDMHILDIPMFCLKEICKRLLNSIGDLCSVTEVCTTLKDAATLAFEEKVFKRGTRITLKKQMQTDVRLLQCFRHSISRVEIDAEDREHFNYIFSSLKKMSPNVLRFLIFVNQRYFWSGLEVLGCRNYFNYLSTVEVENLLPVFPHLEGLTYTTSKYVIPRLPPNLRIFNINFLCHKQQIRGTFDTINANLHKIVITRSCLEFFMCTTEGISTFGQLLQLSPQIKEITIDGWFWCSSINANQNRELNEINMDEMVQHAPQLEILSIYTANNASKISISIIQKLKKMRNLKIFNLSLNAPSVEHLNAINELNVDVECLTLSFPQWNYEFCVSMRNFNHLKLLIIYRFFPLEGSIDLFGLLPQLSVLILKQYVITLNEMKKIISTVSKLTDFHAGQTIESERNLDTKQYLEIVSAARGRSNELHLRIWLGNNFSTNIDSKVFCDNVKYVNVMHKIFKLELHPACGFTV